MGDQKGMHEERGTLLDRSAPTRMLCGQARQIVSEEDDRLVYGRERAPPQDEAQPGFAMVGVLPPSLEW